MRGSIGWALAFALLAWAGQAGARANYTGYSGAPGRQTCANSCHGGSSGTVSVTGFPALYTPGTPYTITVARTSGSNLRNFNGSCRLGQGSSNAGVLSGGQGTSTYNVNGETNGIHCSSGNLVSCTFTWTAPAPGAGTARLYIGAYQGSSENGQTTELTLVAEEGSAGEPALAISQVSVLNDDDGDGLAEAGESAALRLTVENSGTSRASDITGVLTTDSPWVQFTETESDWPNISAGQSAENETDFLLFVDPALPQDTVVPLSLLLNTDQGPFTLEGELTVHWEAPDPLDLGASDAVVLGDDDGDGVLEPGESCTLNVTLMNYGSQPLSGLSAQLEAVTPWLEVLVAGADFPDLPPLNSAQALTAFSLHLAENALPLYDEVLVLQVSSDQGPGAAVFSVPVGARQEIWATDLESGADGWNHSAAAGWNDDWRLTEAGFGSPTTAWKCGAADDGSYQNHQDAGLVTPAVTLLPWSRLEFQHSMSAEVSGVYPDSAYDGGVVEISLDDGASWEAITPLSDYPAAFRYLTGSGNPTTHPFPGGTPCYSGSIGWEPVSFDLQAYGAVPVRFRFHFGSDNGTALGGWIIDDLRVYGLFEDTGLEAPAGRPAALSLLPAQPNPFNPGTRLAWEMERAGSARLELFNLRGQRVRQLAQGEFGAGRHELQLDGAGLATGAYWVRVEALGEQCVQRVLLLK
ncbi:MAG: hypothetical protein WC326_14120 [Candidatus Delongbacteria bacterium]